MMQGQTLPQYRRISDVRGDRRIDGREHERGALVSTVDGQELARLEPIVMTTLVAFAVATMVQPLREIRR